jgi:hypothetical protein
VCGDSIQDQLQHNPGVTANGGRLSCATGFRVVLSVLHETMQTKRHLLFNQRHCKSSTITRGLRKLAHRNCARSGLNPNLAAPPLPQLLRRQQRNHVANDSLLFATELLSKFRARYAPLPFLFG